MHEKPESLYEETANIIEAKTGLNVWFVEVVGKRKSFLGGKFPKSFSPPIEMEITPRIHMFVELPQTPDQNAAKQKSENTEKLIQEAVSIAKSKLL